MHQSRAEAILAHDNKLIAGDIVWKRRADRAVEEFEVCVESDLDERICFAGQFVPEAGIFKLQLFAGERTPIYRFESNKKHHLPTCPWLKGPHINRFTDADPRFAEPENDISSTNIWLAIQQFVERVRVKGLANVGVQLPKSVQRKLNLEGGD